MKIKTRFAPSPTGFLHIGGLRTALFGYLFAKSSGGKFVLRVEDTDRERFVEGGIENMIRSLQWAGITIDEGVDMDDTGEIIQKGKNGPYIQSERTDIYRDHVQKLLDNGQAYYCFCSKEKLDQARKQQEADKKPTIYDGCCRNMPEDEVRTMLEEEREHVIRMKMPAQGITEFNDMIRGDIEFKNKLIDDQVLLKSDGYPTYHLANVVDDYLMGITHVIRGEEWLPSTPKHIELYKMFDWDVPEFAHLPLLVNEKKQKLSKRHGDVSVEDFKEKGYLKEAIVNFIALLGWNPGDDREIFGVEELESEFDIAKVGKSAAVFSREKLDWFNREYIRNMDVAELVDRCMPFFVNAGLQVESIKYKVESVIALEKERVSTLVELVDEVSFVFAKELDYGAELLIWKKSTREDAKEKLSELEIFLQDIEDWDSIEESVMAWIKENDYGNGDVLWPMRVALSGKKNSPGPFEIANVLGKDKVLQRLNRAIKLL